MVEFDTSTRSTSIIDKTMRRVNVEEDGIKNRMGSLPDSDYLECRVMISCKSNMYQYTSFGYADNSRRKNQMGIQTHFRL
jgi:hypothetical protein